MRCDCLYYYAQLGCMSNVARGVYICQKSGGGGDRKIYLFGRPFFRKYHNKNGPIEDEGVGGVGPKAPIVYV